VAFSTTAETRHRETVSFCRWGTPTKRPVGKLVFGHSYHDGNLLEVAVLDQFERVVGEEAFLPEILLDNGKPNDDGVVTELLKVIMLTKKLRLGGRPTAKSGREFPKTSAGIDFKHCNMTVGLTSGQPTSLACFWASSNWLVGRDHCPRVDPLPNIALWNRPRDMGETRWRVMLQDPAL
jgi:hypothetical protein